LECKFSEKIAEFRLQVSDFFLELNPAIRCIFFWQKSQKKDAATIRAHIFAKITNL
jgi:hypothetical protein